MSSEKKDLTRIEDLDEYLHELSEDESSFEPPEEIPSTEEAETIDFGESGDFITDEPAPHQEDSVTDFSFEQEPATDTADEVSFTSTDDLFTPAPETPFNEEINPIEEPHQTPVESATASDIEDIFTESDRSEEASESAPEVTQSFLPATEEKSFKAPETFEDIKRFAESTSFAGMGAEGNPSFSVLLKNVRYLEDVTEIAETLKELGLLSDSEEQTKSRLMRGHLLVPRISEYAAIYLAHKLRRFDIDIQVGLSDEIHPPKHQELPETGIVSRHNLYQNQTHHFHFDDPKLELSQIIVAASSNLEGHQIIRYLGVASEHKMLAGHVIEDEAGLEIPQHYAELAQKLKAHALKAHANAIVGLNYQLTPLPSDFGASGSRYRLSCTGNLVWVNKL